MSVVKDYLRRVPPLLFRVEVSELLSELLLVLLEDERVLVEVGVRFGVPEEERLGVDEVEPDSLVDAVGVLELLPVLGDGRVLVEVGVRFGVPEEERDVDEVEPDSFVDAV